MSGNGKTNGDNGAPDLSGLFGLQEREDLSLFRVYVSYEQFVNTLLWAAIQNKLRIYEARSNLDVISLEREFRGYCVPQDWKPPYKLYAELYFYWPPEYTVVTAHGDESICALYHYDDEECAHAPGAADLLVELEVLYQMPEALVNSLDSDAGIEAVARRIRSLFAEAAPGANAVSVEVGASFADDGLRLTSIAARGFTALQEEMHDVSKLAMALLEAMDDVSRALKRFAKEFAADQEGLQP